MKPLRKRGARETIPATTRDEEKRIRIWKRIGKLGTHELLDYIDEAGAGMNRGLADYRRDGDVSALHEIDDALLALKVITEELIIRWEAENEGA